MRRFIFYISLLFLICLAGCRQDSEPEIPSPGKTDEIDVSISINVAPSTYSMDGTAENHVETIDVLAFLVDEGAGTEIYSYRAIGREIKDITTDTKQFIVGLKKNSNKYRFVVLANVQDEIDKIYHDMGGPKDQVLARVLSRNAGAWNTDENNYTPIPMWGESPVTTISEGMEIKNVALLRALLRVDLKSTASKFVLKEVYLYNRTTRGRVVPEKDKWDLAKNRVKAPSMPADNDGSDPLSIRGPLLYNVTAGASSLVGTIYMYEVNETSEDSKATCLVVGGIYDTDNELSYYRIDFVVKGEGGGSGGGPPGSGTGGGGAVGTETGSIPLLRNYFYELSIIGISGSGEDSYEKAFAKVTKSKSGAPDRTLKKDRGKIEVTINRRDLQEIGSAINSIEDNK